MEGRRPTPMTNLDGVGGGGAGIGDKPRGIPGRDFMGNNGVTPGIRRNQSVGDLSKRRRHANDPAMMRELKRYQRIMLLTSLPLISSEDDVGYVHPPSQNHNLDADFMSLRFPSHGLQAPETVFEQEAAELDKNLNSEHLPKPEPTDTVVSGPHSPLCKSPQQAKSACGTRCGESKTLTSAPASAGTRLPLTVCNPLLSPKRNNKKKSQEEIGQLRKRSQEDIAKEVGDVGGRISGPTMNGPSVGAMAGGDLDLLTLAALYLESRHRVLGQEWHYRPENAANVRTNCNGCKNCYCQVNRNVLSHRTADLFKVGPTAATQQVGAMGLARPRRLSPLSPSREGKDNQTRRLEHRRSFSGVMPAPAGLHLSCNYTHNLGLDESEYLEKRARALKPRLRRLNSLEDVSATPLTSPDHSLHRPTSAPDISHNNNGKHHNARRDSQGSQESFSPTLATPARANTPTGAENSAALSRPQIVGGSLATNTTVEAPKPMSTLGDGTQLQGNQNGGYHRPRSRTRTQIEGSKIALQPPPRANRLLGLPPEHSALEQSIIEFPLAPPPSAAIESHRRPSKVHLQPLSIRKASH
ncbi:hypothetical protein SK128_008964 [Halocaridina rubra]|uniref:Uncharacterized protein n=1 Tax=Halocaridina rubra TaxID=373956 RepID=A0AAN8WXL6_HALRR